MSFRKFVSKGQASLGFCEELAPNPEKEFFLQFHPQKRSSKGVYILALSVKLSMTSGYTEDLKDNRMLIMVN